MKKQDEVDVQDQVTVALCESSSGRAEQSSNGVSVQKRGTKQKHLENQDV